MKHVPEFIAVRYGSAHEFRKRARNLAKNIHMELNKLRIGCAYFPCGASPMIEIEKQLDIIRKAISVKEWGR